MRSLQKFVQYSDADILGNFPCSKTTTMAAHSRTSLLKNAVYFAEENSFLFYILAGNNSFSVQNGIDKGTVSGSGTGPLDYGATGPVPDTPMRTVSGSGSF